MPVDRLKGTLSKIIQNANMNGIKVLLCGMLARTVGRSIMGNMLMAAKSLFTKAHIR